MNFILVDGPNRDHLLPFTFTRAVAELRLGILTIREKWEYQLKTICEILSQDYLEELYAVRLSADSIYINSAVLPTPELIHAIKNLRSGERLTANGALIALRSVDIITVSEFNRAAGFQDVEYKSEITTIKNPWDLFVLNGEAIASDIELIKEDRLWEKAPSNCNILGEDAVFIEKGAKLNFVNINANDGPVFIGSDAEVMEGSMIRGPFALCSNSTLKMGAKIYGGTTIGPHCKIGGEVNNSIFMAYSNKAHDGFIGNSVIGEWCNLGADTNNSNLKNNYGNVRVWNYQSQSYIDSKRQFCGMFMGDHSKAGINTMFNTGTVIGVSSNIFGGGFPAKHIPSFSWGGAEGFDRFKLDKAIEVATAMYKRRGLEFGETETSIMQYLHENLQ